MKAEKPESGPDQASEPALLKAMLGQKLLPLLRLEREQLSLQAGADLDDLRLRIIGGDGIHELTGVRGSQLQLVLVDVGHVENGLSGEQAQGPDQPILHIVHLHTPSRDPCIQRVAETSQGPGKHRPFFISTPLPSLCLIQDPQDHLEIRQLQLELHDLPIRTGILQVAGRNDGRILEANQVIAYFAYANRTVLGLGVATEGDILGLAPANLEDSDDWSHR